jgi:RimJ/RimL family protein N-acetyltransferase
VQLTDFTEVDYPTLINWICSEELNYLWGGPLYRYPITCQQIAQHCGKDGIYPYLLTVKGEAAGYAELCRESESQYRVCRVFIADRYKGRGYAKQMLQLLVELAKDKFDAQTLTLAVFEHNVVALNLYRALGFQSMAEERCRLPNNEVWPLLRMEKRL